MNNTEYALIKIMEECSEVQQACSKALRFGFDSYNPVSLVTNLETLRNELGDLTVAIQELESEMAVDLNSSDEELTLKLSKFLRFREISKSLGILE